MPPKSLRPCKKQGCQQLTRTTYCETHQGEREKEIAHQNKRYDTHKRTGATFYQGAAWRRVRDRAYKRDHGLCQMCMRDGKVVKADVVHHKEEVKQNWEKRFDLDNLESICHKCHNREHKSAKR